MLLIMWFPDNNQQITPCKGTRGWLTPLVRLPRYPVHSLHAKLRVRPCFSQPICNFFQVRVNKFEHPYKRAPLYVSRSPLNSRMRNSSCAMQQPGRRGYTAPLPPWTYRCTGAQLTGVGVVTVLPSVVFADRKRQKKGDQERLPTMTADIIGNYTRRKECFRRTEGHTN